MRYEKIFVLCIRHGSSPFRLNKGKWRDMKWKQLKHDMSDEKPRGGWMEFEYVMDLAPGTQDNYFKIG